MNTILERTIGILQDEAGVTSTEYALIGSLLSVVFFAGAAVIGDKLNEIFTRIAGAF
jgi:Flp pilus assembly pilin Flp